MMLLRSGADGFARMGWLKLGIGLAVVWLLPSVVALASLGVQWLADTRSIGPAAMLVWLSTVLLAASPLISWFGLILAAPLVAALMNLGWFGWLPALLLGMAAGGALGFLIGNGEAVWFGALLLVMLRAVLGRLYPPAFDLTSPPLT